MFPDLKSRLQSCLTETVKETCGNIADFPSVDIETPADKEHGEFSTNIALKSAKVLRKSPLQIAQDLLPSIEKAVQQGTLQGLITKVEVKNPGFINFFVSPRALFHILEEIFEKKDSYGQAKIGRGQKILIEFVSANPTGPLSVAHARQAAVGDVLGNILKALGFFVTKEFYVNDGGKQIRTLGESLRLRAKEILGERIPFPEECYQGEYIREMAQIFLDKKRVNALNKLERIKPEEWSAFGATYLLDVIKKELADFNVCFDVWSFESKIAGEKNILNVLNELKKNGHIFEKDGALWFQSTKYGDDKDRVVRKSDGYYTYLMPDMVYHKNKFARGFNKVINIWGPDHHGYIPRIKAAAQALGKEPSAVEVLIVQLATIFRNGVELSMSTRRGQFISLREVLNEVGVDAARFFFLMRHISMHLDFDLELAKKQSPENPVYYVQYGHARVYSMNKKAEEARIKMRTKSFSLFREEEELDLIKRLSQFPHALERCHQELDPYALVSYMQELAMAFHKFYDQCRVIDINHPELSSERLSLVNAAKIVFANGLRLLGVKAPEKM